MVVMRALKTEMKMECYSVERKALRKVHMRVSKTAETKECLILTVQMTKMVGLLFETQLMML
jgi:hypothetical protein